MPAHAGHLHTLPRPHVCAHWLQSTGEWDGPAKGGCFRFVPFQLHTKGTAPIAPPLSMCHQGCTHKHTSASVFLWDDKPMNSCVQTSFRKKSEDQRHVTFVITSLHYLLDRTHDPRQLQLGNGKCLNRTAWTPPLGVQPQAWDATALSKHIYPALTSPSLQMGWL